MAFEHLAYLLSDVFDPADVFVAKAQAGFDAAVVHLPRVFNRVGGKDRIGDVQRAAIKCAQTGVIPTDALNGSF